MRRAIVIEPQEGQTYAEILAVAQRAEALGFDGFYRSDHYSTVWRSEDHGSTDAWATLAGLARDTDRISIGTMVSPVTFRPAANTAKVVATVNEMAGTADGASRVHLGLGTGWLESEHRMYGFAYGDVAGRFRRLDEHIRVITGLWDAAGRPFSFDGEFEQLVDAVFLPQPDPRPRIVVGGNGRVKTVRLAATHADEMNTPWATPDDVRELRGLLDQAATRADRPPVPLTVTTACLIGRDQEELLGRARELHALIGGGDLEEWLAARRAQNWAIGTREEVLAHVTALVEAGAAGVTLMHLLPHDVDMLDVVRDALDGIPTGPSAG